MKFFCIYMLKILCDVATLALFLAQIPFSRWWPQNKWEFYRDLWQMFRHDIRMEYQRIAALRLNFVSTENETINH